jgi:protein SCO1/2
MKLIFSILLTFIFVSCNSNEKVRVLPIVGNYDIEYDTIDGKEVADTVYPKIPFFQFKNQNGKVISSKDLKGKVWIADFFFTKCPTICPTMIKFNTFLLVLTQRQINQQYFKNIFLKTELQLKTGCF